jgi:hypothetical protein
LSALPKTVDPKDTRTSFQRVVDKVTGKEAKGGK